VQCHDPNIFGFKPNSQGCITKLAVQQRKVMKKNKSDTYIKDSHSSEEITRENIRERIKQALTGQNIAAIATKMSVAPSTVYDWQNGRSLPDVERLALFANLTSSDVCWLITGRRDDYLVPVGLNVFPTPLAFLSDWLTEISRMAGAKLDDLVMLAISDDAMQPALFRGELALAWRLPRHDVGRNQFLAAGENGLYALQVIARKGDRQTPPLTRTITRRLRWGMGDETVSITCDNESYANENRVWKIKEAPLIVGPIVWKAGAII
jgi:transcriptional regulator with XRE-family HTH domain